MIPADRRVLDNLGVAQAKGYGTLRTAQRNKLFDDPTLPASLTTGKYKKWWDEEQIHAWAKGEPIPELPTQKHPDDLLDTSEAAAVLGITPSAWVSYRKRDSAKEREALEREARGEEEPEVVYQLPTVAEAAPEGEYYYRREDVETWHRPGRGAPGVPKGGPRRAWPRR